ncbi:glycosyltransferase family 2 protein [Pseudalkalibacillus hwajinpoensis]|uniref:glycosyltransferase family 2 protein n=1 Tax=Guptibacillus hwajinpoensis TaxID=208199 RepID=UPI001CD4EEC2|nr:glycosyltransferase family 2 protein [Pseudalkalibacillus hwajinpoensis]MCA0991381.1 glycosyltransferase family 2 protein [Pseudalkalibacillus hwajinpoensis]
MIGIIILNYVTWDETARCIESIFIKEKKSKYHIYLVDNASKVDAPQKIKDLLKDSRVTLIENKENNGYSAGNNVGIKRAILDGCKEILISNNDIIFTQNSIYEMKKYLDANKKVGIVGPKIFLPNGDIQMINMGVKTGLKEKYKYLLRKTIFAPLVGEFLREFCATDKDLTKPFEVHSVSGCCFMMSEECAKAITPFDENTFLYQEELIIGMRMEKKGYKTVYLPASEITHAHGQSTKHIKAFSYTCLVSSELYYFKRYINASILVLTPLYIFRTSKYLFYAIKYNDFKKNTRNYFKETLNTLILKN